MTVRFQSLSPSRCRAALPLLVALPALLVVLGCTHSAVAPDHAESSATSESGPTVAEATAFAADAEARLLDAYVAAERSAWVATTFITLDTEAIDADYSERLMALVAELAEKAARFNGLEVPYDVRRKLDMIRLAISLPAPLDSERRSRLAKIASQLTAAYGKGVYCKTGDPNSADADGSDCRNLDELSKVMAKSRDYDELLEAWAGWRTISPSMKSNYSDLVNLGNEGARSLGFGDLGELWRSRYDMPADDFSAQVDRLWSQVEPLYKDLHCHVRAKLVEMYGTDKVDPTGPIPAHLLGNMWSQEWLNLYDVLAPEPGSKLDVNAAIRAKKFEPEQMVRYGESFFSSLGFDPLPETFWQRSMFTRPRDRDVVCHASAWNIDYVDDLRIKMCIEPTEEDFTTIHHELGHTYYQRAYAQLDGLYRESANDGFHEALGDTIALSVTPSYLVKVGIFDSLPPDSLNPLMRKALDKVAFLPFGLLIDKWRWQVFAGDVEPADYTKAWWSLRHQYQGIKAPIARDGDAFDPGAKYHVPGNTPYARYFLAHILQFQFHRALCKIAGHTGPLHECSIFESKAAGARLSAMMQMGSGRPWPDALEALTGSREVDASAILDYFAPLHAWLKTQNESRSCGW